MALTNADRQRRHRERVKAKLAEVEAPAAPDLLQRLVKAYRDAGVALLAHEDDGKAGEAATCSFLAEGVTEATIFAAVEKAGKVRISQIYHQQVEAQIVEMRKRPRGKYS